MFYVETKYEILSFSFYFNQKKKLGIEEANNFLL